MSVRWDCPWLCHESCHVTAPNPDTGDQPGRRPLSNSSWELSEDPRRSATHSLTKIRSRSFQAGTSPCLRTNSRGLASPISSLCVFPVIAPYATTNVIPSRPHVNSPDAFVDPNSKAVSDRLGCVEEGSSISLRRLVWFKHRGTRTVPL